MSAPKEARLTDRECSPDREIGTERSVGRPPAGDCSLEPQIPTIAQRKTWSEYASLAVSFPRRGSPGAKRAGLTARFFHSLRVDDHGRVPQQQLAAGEFLPHPPWRTDDDAIFIAGRLGHVVSAQ